LNTKTLVVLIVGWLLQSAAAQAQCMLNYRVVAQYPHDPKAFTQGLTLLGDDLLESTGMYGASLIRRVALETGETLGQTKLPRRYFGEGLAHHAGQLYQLSWKRGRLFIYDAETLKRTGNRHYRGQGWGLTHDTAQFIMSDGSSQLQFRNSGSFAIERKQTVTLRGEALKRLNELEWIEGRLFANVWQDSQIYIINTENGMVEYQLELDAIARRHIDQGVLNGIAWDSSKQELLITGKYWDKLYRLSIDLPWRKGNTCPAQ
jgi:glutamine cyclotransferase